MKQYIPIQLTEIFREAVESHPKPKYRLALKAGVRPQTFYALYCGVLPLKENDSRIIAIGAELGLEPVECFADKEAK